MSEVNLVNEVSAFCRLLPGLRKKYGASWVIIVGDECVGAFETFAQAAEFGISHFADSEFLIRHTDSPEPQVPFALVEA